MLFLLTTDISSLVYVISVTVCTVLVIGLSFLYFYLQPNETSTIDDPLLKKAEQKAKKPAKDQRKVPEEEKKKKNKDEAGLLRLKSHTEEILGVSVSPDGKWLATCSRDRTLRVWCLETLQTDPQARGIRINLQFDHSTCVVWALPDLLKKKKGPTGGLPYFLIGTLAESKEVVGFELIEHLHKHKDAKSFNEILRFPTKHSNSITSVASSGPTTVSTANASFTTTPLLATACIDTEVKLWDLWSKTLLQTVSTNQLETYQVNLSPEGRFLSVATRMSDTRIWEVMRKKDGGFDQVKKVMQLTGHKASVHSVVFNSKSTRVYTASKDLTWKLWKIDVRYHIGESTECISTGSAAPFPGPNTQLALSSDDKFLARTSTNGSVLSIQIFKAESGKLVETFSLPSDGAGEQASLVWSLDGKYLFASFQSKAVTVFDTSHLVQK